MRGGKRKGSGRKPRSMPLKAVTVKLSTDDFEKLKDLCKKHGLSQAKLISYLINQ